MEILFRIGWYSLLIGLLGDILIPIVLAPFYKGYNPSTMTVSALGNPQSPVRIVFNLWMLLEGILILSAVPTVYNYFINASKTLTILVVIFMSIFAVGACILTCFFSVSETKDVVTTASKIHGAGSVIGFFAFLFVPLLISILEFMKSDALVGIIAIISFALALLFFVLFVMSDKPCFSNTIVAKEGLWQRLNILFMILPTIVISVHNIFEIR